MAPPALEPQERLSYTAGMIFELDYPGMGVVLAILIFDYSSYSSRIDRDTRDPRLKSPACDLPLTQKIFINITMPIMSYIIVFPNHSVER